MGIDNLSVKTVQIMTLKKSGKSLQEISDKLGIPYITVRRILKNHDKTKLIGRKKEFGRKKKLSIDNINFSASLARNNSRKNCTELANQLMYEKGATVSAETVRRELHGVKLVNATAAQKPLLTKIHIE